MRVCKIYKNKPKNSIKIIICAEENFFKKYCNFEGFGV